MTGSPHLREPHQDRSRRTLRRLLCSARELLAEHPFDDVSVEDIAERAGSSKGSFYQRFPDKESLLLYLLEIETEEARERWTAFFEPERWCDASLREVLEAFVDRVVDIYRGRRYLMRAFTDRIYSGEAPGVERRAVELNRLVVEGLRRLVLDRADEVAHPDPRVACSVVVLALSAMLPRLLLRPPSRGSAADLGPEVLEAEIRRMMVDYLAGPAPAASHAG